MDDSRHQAHILRNMPLISHGDDFVNLYRLSEELIQQLEEELHHLLPLVGFCVCYLKLNVMGKGSEIDLRYIVHYRFWQVAVIKKYYEEILHVASISIPQPKSCFRSCKSPRHCKKIFKISSERLALQERFYQKFHIPGIIGCIDGTLVAIVRPNKVEERFYWRKRFHARNVMLICDADLNIIHVDASYGGATHDSYIFNSSVIKQKLEYLTSAGEVLYVLGDSGYPQRSYLMTPIINAAENNPESYYNHLHATARNTIERAIGILKARFRCLLVHRILHYDPETVSKIIVACCVLHNIYNRAGLPAPVLCDEDVERERSLIQERDHRNSTSTIELTTRRNSRSNLVNRLWQNRII